MNKEKIIDITKKLNEKKDGYKFPRWEDFPNVDLYMDQVTELVNKYFSEFSDFFGEDFAITPAMINNYVKSKSMPAPEKKRYSRLHIAYIMIICVLKQTFSLSVIQELLLSADEHWEEESARKMYNEFAKSQEDACKNAISRVVKLLESGYDIDSLLMMKLVSEVNIQRSVVQKLVCE